MDQNNYIIFVYGTLMKNQTGHDLIKNGKFIGRATTKPLYQLYSCGSYPALVEKDGQNEVEGELYEINQDIKDRLDIYEGVSHGLYEFRRIQLNKIQLVNFESIPEKLEPFAYFYLGETTTWKKITKWTCLDF